MRDGINTWRIVIWGFEEPTLIPTKIWLKKKKEENLPEDVLEDVAGEEAKTAKFVLNAGHDSLNNGELGAQANGG